MMNLPLTRDLVLIGGGHTHALVLRMWGMNPLPGVRVTVVNPGPTAPYSGMLPGFVAGHYSRDELDIDLVRLARFAGARLIVGAADGIDRIAKTVSVPGRPPIAYDVLSVDVGITSDMPQLPGFTDHAVSAKPLGKFASCWESYRNTAQDSQLAVIGGGVAGAELAMAMAHALRDRSPKVTLLDRGTVLSALGDTAQGKMCGALETQGVKTVENAEVVEVIEDGVLLADGQRIPSDFTIGAAGAKAHDWIAGTNLDLHDGYITVGPDLRSNDPDIFAVGDCAHLGFDPRPKAGVYAVRQAPVLFQNLRTVLSGGKLTTYKPQKDYLKLISLGAKSALAEKFGTAKQGPLLWRLKDHIDRKFMRQFDDLPEMEAPKLPRVTALGMAEALGDKPMCGGCGAKVGRAALQNVLAGQFGDDAAEIQPGQVISTDHLRALTNDPVTMTSIAATHALGDIWAMGAKPQAATVSLILPRMSSALQERTLVEIMATATEILNKAGAKVAGGHSSLGDELTIGFTITGLTDAPITLAGAKVGDAIILTKPIGSGTIMAAEMAGNAKGADVISCLELMMQGQARASEILHIAHAMTDVTGFGLAGHLRGICDMSGTGAVLKRDEIPVMQGAQSLCDTGTRSSLFADNVVGAGQIQGPLFDLLYDPQTAGGLLAAVSRESAEQILADLKKAGYPAAIIGEITTGDTIKIV
ncbi:selenide, water dikinase SelD [Yoonia maritima]|uniref:selenide, water dikinase SelD n=1 Tax=Yoonia maritima TaxID=1435347 RepID=UPI003736FB2F